MSRRLRWYGFRRSALHDSTNIVITTSGKGIRFGHRSFFHITHTLVPGKMCTSRHLGATMSTMLATSLLVMKIMIIEITTMCPIPFPLDTSITLFSSRTSGPRRTRRRLRRRRRWTNDAADVLIGSSCNGILPRHMSMFEITHSFVPRKVCTLLDFGTKTSTKLTFYDFAAKVIVGEITTKGPVTIPANAHDLQHNTIAKANSNALFQSDLLQEWCGHPIYSWGIPLILALCVDCRGVLSMWSTVSVVAAIAGWQHWPLSTHGWEVAFTRNRVAVLGGSIIYAHYESMTMTMTIVLSQTSLMQAQCKTSLDVETWRRWIIGRLSHESWFMNHDWQQFRCFMWLSSLQSPQLQLAVPIRGLWALGTALAILWCRRRGTSATPIWFRNSETTPSQVRSNRLSCRVYCNVLRITTNSRKTSAMWFIWALLGFVLYL